MSLVELKDPTVEEVKALIAQLEELPMNKSMFVLKELNTEEIAHAAGVYQNMNKASLDAAEKKILRPMYVLSVSSDIESDIKPLDRVRASRITEVVGKPIECSIKNYKVAIIRDYDVLTVIKGENK